ncbi:MAG: hypothetical protein HY327_04185 [Chloroflexi bacterium]|nr:hypothetical protein [Chloroflexota bacterium]
MKRTMILFTALALAIIPLAGVGTIEAGATPACSAGEIEATVPVNSPLPAGVNTYWKPGDGFYHYCIAAAPVPASAPAPAPATDPVPPPPPPPSAPAGGFNGTSAQPPPAQFAKEFPVIIPGPAANPMGGAPIDYYAYGVTIPGASVPSGQNYLSQAWVPAVNGLPVGNGGIAFRGPGSSLVAFRIWIENGDNTIHSLNSPGARVCFTYPPDIQFDTFGEAIQYYTGNSSNPWVTLAGPYTRTVLVAGVTPGWVQLCTQVTSF